MEILPENSLDIPPGISSVNPSRISAWILSDNDPGMPSGISSPIPLEIHFFKFLPVVGLRIPLGTILKTSPEISFGITPDFF